MVHLRVFLFISTVGSLEMLSFCFYSVEFSATVLQKYSTAFCCLKCVFRMTSCFRAFALKHTGVVK